MENYFDAAVFSENITFPVLNSITVANLVEEAVAISSPLGLHWTEFTYPLFTKKLRIMNSQTKEDAY